MYVYIYIYIYTCINTDYINHYIYICMDLGGFDSRNNPRSYPLAVRYTIMYNNIVYYDIIQHTIIIITYDDMLRYNN